MVHFYARARDVVKSTLVLAYRRIGLPENNEQLIHHLWASARFVRPYSLEDFHPPRSPKAKRAKLAIIQALIAANSYEIGIKAEGSGGSVRIAASRALMNLLGKPNLRQRRLTNLQIELSIFNLSETQDSNPDCLPD